MNAFLLLPLALSSLTLSCLIAAPQPLHAQSLDDHPNTHVLSDTEIEYDFVRTRTCGGPEGNPCSEGRHPIPLEWSRRRIEYRINEQGSDDFHPQSDQVSDELQDAVIDSFEVWNTPECSDFLMDFAGLTTSDHIGYREHRDDNENIVVWRDHEWPYSGQAVGLTTVTFNGRNGEIFDADIELNTHNYEFTDSDSDVNIDLRNTLTHEIGHFLGLDHSLTEPEATMWFSTDSGETNKRDLHEADIAGLCAIYPDGEQSELLRDDDSSSSCALVTSSNSTPPLLVITTLFGLFLLRRRSST